MSDPQPSKPARFAILARLAVVLAWLAVPLGVAGAVILLMEPSLRQTVLSLLAFGVWSGLCVGYGIRVGRYRQALSVQANAEEMFQWIRTGKTKPRDGADSPPLNFLTPPPNRPSGGAPL